MEKKNGESRKKNTYRDTRLTGKYNRDKEKEQTLSVTLVDGL